MTTFNWEDYLREHNWEEGKLITLQASWRVRVVFICFANGKQKAEFANGKHNYATYVELTRPNGDWIKDGVVFVPVLPNGRILMVVEQRPAQGRYDQATEFVRDGQTVDLQHFGPYSSLEFPGGGVDSSDASIASGLLRELKEETGAKPSGTLFMMHHPFHQTGADIALSGRLGVLYLDNTQFESWTPSDGGLHVFDLSYKDVLWNVRNGNIRSGQAGLEPWRFYNEVRAMQLNERVDGEYVTCQYVRAT